MNAKKELYLVFGIVLLILIPILVTVTISRIDHYQLTKYSAVLGVALETSNPSLCQKIHYKELEDNCYSELGIKRSLPELCEKIKNDSLRNNCFYAVAMARRDILLCNKLVKEMSPQEDFLFSPDLRFDRIEQCKNEVQQLIMDDAVKSKDYAHCRNNSECESKIAVLLDDVTHCFKFTDLKNSCLAAIAVNSKEVVPCDSIDNKELKDDCIFSVAKTIVDYKVCNIMLHKEKNKACLDYFYCNDKDRMCYPNDNREYREKIKLIVKQDSAAECDELPQLAKEFCYFEFALKELNPSLCNPLKYQWSGHESQDYNLQEECYNSVAIYSSDKTVCARTIKYKDDCVKQILMAEGELNITKNMKMREVFRGSAGIWGDLPSIIYINEGNVYAHSSEYGCYLPGAIMPGGECLVHEWE